MQESMEYFWVYQNIKLILLPKIKSLNKHENAIYNWSIWDNFDEQKRVLLVHRRDYDLWNLPGGTLEDFESPKNAVIHEVREETGLEVKVFKLLGVYNKENKNDIAFLFMQSYRWRNYFE